MEFSKKMLVLHIFLSICLCIATIVGSLRGVDMTAVGILAGTSFVTDGAWGGFYYWKSKNENRYKYAHKFVKLLAEEYGVDAAIRMAEIVLKD
jgi:hypothetical protein